jgi:hypothetical protein
MQDDTKHTMIQNMDRIYNDATITLINSAGSNSDSGLPGVSRAPRRKQTAISLKHRRLTLLPNVKSEINSSKWASRGWTYQEALLSRRRLVFTRSQLYFQCHEMHCCESVTITMKSEGTSTWADKALETDLQAFPRGGKHVTDATEVADRLQEYLQRQLTYESDTLDAFAGVLRHFWYVPDPVYHIWGLPFQPPRVLKALLWMPQLGAGPHLARKDMFPSWTWAAWRQVPGLLENDCIWQDQRFEVSVEVVTTSGEVLTIEEYISSMTESLDIYRFKPMIVLTGWTTDLRFYGIAGHSVGNTTVFNVFDTIGQVQFTKASVITASILERSTAELRAQSYTTWPVFLFIRSDGGLTGLVLEHISDDSYARRGILDRAFFEPMTKFDDDSGRLRKRHWDLSVWIECERRMIELV